LYFHPIGRNEHSLELWQDNNLKSKVAERRPFARQKQF
jgi:hypothetical protein